MNKAINSIAIKYKYMKARARQTELCQNAAAGGFVVVPAIIGVLDLRMGGGVCDIQPLEGSHGAAAKQG